MKDKPAPRDELVGAAIEAVDGPVFSEQVEALYRPRSVVPINVGVAALAVIMFRGLFPAWTLLLWFGLLSALVLGRMWLRHAYWRAADRKEAAPRWARSFVAGAVATGIVWGLCGLVIVPADTIHATLAVFTLGGMAAGSMVASSAYLPAFYGFALPAVLPAVLILALTSGPGHLQLAGMLALFAAVLAIAGRSINQTIFANVRLRIEQGDLLARMSKSEERFRTVSEAIPDAFVMAEDNGLICYWNPAAERIFGYSAGEAAGRPVHELLLPEPLRARAAAFFQSFAATGDGAATGNREFTAIRKDGAEVPVEVLLGSFQLRQDRTVFALIRDITARKEAEAQVAYTARHDALTGLANRPVLVEATQHAIAQAANGGTTFAVLCLDLDHFKDVNDTLGHSVGDYLLRLVADRLRANTRDADTIARFSGDEFGIVVPCIGDPADAARLADRLVQAMREPFPVEGNEIHIGASIGIDLYGPAAADAETLLSHAGVALHRAKAEERGAYHFFTESMDAEVRTRVTMGVELREAIGADQFFLVYQPQVDIETGHIIGVEALLRWRHPRLGVIGPDDFIAQAEKVGLAGQIGHWVLWAACREAKAWLDAGAGSIRTAVNLSALQFKTPQVLENDITAALAGTGLPPDRLELEITESVVMDSSRDHDSLLLKLRERGVKIAIDDFGTGYSSLDYLRRFPVDRIKIAQNFVRNIETAPGSAAIVRATLGLAHELGIEAIAEGVETQAAVEMLKGWGCREAQGYYFSKPVAAAELLPLLRSNRPLGSAETDGASRSVAAA
jgi:diguanylate cyclase (GGDEF)-like protein/PAS domain S-box-containing protein